MKESISETISISILGPEMGIFIGFGFFLGHHADTHYGTQPYFTWLGLLLGIGCAGCALFCAGRRAQKKMTSTDNKP